MDPHNAFAPRRGFSNPRARPPAWPVAAPGGGHRGSGVGAFTLIELLIVVAIIAILAAIAVPNFLEAQTRAKVSRVKADFRSIATGLESYRVDANRYPPNDHAYNVLPVQLTTPIAYLTNVRFADPFTDKERVVLPNIDPSLARYYTYTQIMTYEQANAQLLAGGPAEQAEAVDGVAYNEGALSRYGPWRLVSNGPDRKYPIPGAPADYFNPIPTVLLGADIPYDPTNGTVSRGNILRTQRSQAYPNS